MDFWRHVTSGAQHLVIQSVTLLSLNWAGKAEIYDPHVIIWIEHDVLELEVPVGQAAYIDVLWDLEQLRGHVSDKRLSERSHIGHHAEHITMGQVLEDHVSH